MFPPEDFFDCHAAFRTCRGCIVFEQFRQDRFDGFRIFVAESGSFRKLWIHAAVKDIDAFIDAMFHTHRVGTPFDAVAFSADAFRDLGTGDADRFDTESGLYGDRPANREQEQHPSRALAPERRG